MHCYLSKMLPRWDRTRPKGGTLVPRMRVSQYIVVNGSNQPSPNPRNLTKYLKHPLLHHGKHFVSTTKASPSMLSRETMTVQSEAHMKDVNHSARKSKEFLSVKADGTERSNENRTQTQGKLRPYISSYNTHNIQ